MQINDARKQASVCRGPEDVAQITLVTSVDGSSADWRDGDGRGGVADLSALATWAYARREDRSRKRFDAIMR